MQVHYQTDIVSDADIEMPVPNQGGTLMSGRKDFSFLLSCVGGNTGAADVTMSIRVYADIGPFTVGGTPAVSAEKWVDITKAAYNMETNAYGAASFDFIGNTEDNLLLTLNDLNVDRLKFVASFADVPDSATPARILIKARPDSV